MAKPRPARHDEVMLIPFLDILCSLIGVLILIIVVVCAAHMQKVKGRTRQELRLSERYQALLAQRKDLEKSLPALKAELARLEKLKQDAATKQQQLAELRRRLDASSGDAKATKEKAAKVQKELDDLLRQIDNLAKAHPGLQAEIEQLKKLLADRRKKEEAAKTPSVVVRPSGSGARQGQRLFFVETNGAGLMIHKSKTELVRVPSANVKDDKDYNAFLKTIKDSGGAALIFLIRKDGWGTYQRAAGWAEQNYGLNTGKLPLPADGAVDTSLFEK